MPPLSNSLTTPAPVRLPQYDMQVAVTDAFINRSIALGFATGKLPSSFSLTVGAAEDPLGLTVRADVNFGVSNVELFSKAERAQSIGLRADWSGTVTIRVTLADWHITTPAGTHDEPGLDQTFTIPFDGSFSATADVALRNQGDNIVLAIGFARLDRLDISHIGALSPGADLTEVVRASLERMAVIALRERIQFPGFGALAGSLPMPAKALLDTQSAQIGALDFKVTVGDGAEIADEMQLLAQATQNLGQQSFQSVVSIAEGGGDLAIGLSARFVSQMLQDLWIGGVIPTRFDDSGHPDPSGPVSLERLSFSMLASGKLQLRAYAHRKIIGLPITVNATLEFTPTVSGGCLFASDVAVALDVDVDWARSLSSSSLFFFLYLVVARVLLRGVADVLEPWADAALSSYLDGKGIDLRRRLVWHGLPFEIDVAPAFMSVTAAGLTFGVALNLHV